MLELKNISKTFNPGTVNEKYALHGRHKCIFFVAR